jgi:hypothetical protein
MDSCLKNHCPSGHSHGTWPSSDYFLQFCHSIMQYASTRSERVSSLTGLRIRLKWIEHRWQLFSWIHNLKEDPAAFGWHSKYRTILSVPVRRWVTAVWENSKAVKMWPVLPHSFIPFCIPTINLYFREFCNWLLGKTFWWWEAWSTSVVSHGWTWNIVWSLERRNWRGK